MTAILHPVSPATADHTTLTTTTTTLVRTTVSSGANNPITATELQCYLPALDPATDALVGEWVMVSPERASALLDPLVWRWEAAARNNGSGDGGCCCLLRPEQQQAHGYHHPFYFCGIPALPPAPEPLAPYTEGEPITLAPLSAARSVLCARKRTRALTAHTSNNHKAGRSGDVSDGDGQGDDDDDGEDVDADVAPRRLLLYLHVRLGLLTLSLPAAFGGGDYLEVVAQTSGGSGAVPGTTELRTVFFPTASARVVDASDSPFVWPLYPHRPDGDGRCGCQDEQGHLPQQQHQPYVEGNEEDEEEEERAAKVAETAAVAGAKVEPLRASSGWPHGACSGGDDEADYCGTSTTCRPLDGCRVASDPHLPPFHPSASASRYDGLLLVTGGHNAEPSSGFLELEEDDADWGAHPMDAPVDSITTLW